MTTPKDNTPDELQNLLDEFVLYRDNTPESNEPTELSVFLRQCEYPDAMQRLGDELRDYIAREIAEVISEDETIRNIHPEYLPVVKELNKLRAEQRQRSADRGWRIER